MVSVLVIGLVLWGVVVVIYVDGGDYGAGSANMIVVMMSPSKSG